ncbi:MAG: carbonic anhydrase family protein [Thiomicrospira sp.]|uniref:carbonic anhydrase n=1 Tax=Thiomicrospira sp. TaxID=935 RepID=UPI0019D88E9A|nr:carbonic anhydrase family protein [Thiomicrospira sp.]MBE0494349.1 carbonic anhydrase family protein [Thiomicrospira sp.]
MNKWLAVWALSLLSAGVWAEDPLIDLASEIESEAIEQGVADTQPATQTAQDSEQASSESSATDPQPSTPSLASVLAEPAEWGYVAEKAPRYWAQLDSRYQTCALGKNQSPINLTSQQAVHTRGLPALDIAYRDVPLRLIHSDHGLRGNYPLGSYIRLGEQRYELTHYTFHTPSEHHIEGFAYPMEIHLVHRNGEGHQVVMSVIVQEGENNEQLDTILNNLPNEKDKLQVFERVNFNPVKFLPADKRFYRYIGSMTQPPCNEGVVWLVFTKPIQASIGQLVRLNELMGDNARPLQGLNGRVPMKSWMQGSDAHPSQSSPGYYFDY